MVMESSTQRPAFERAAQPPVNAWKNLFGEPRPSLARQSPRCHSSSRISAQVSLRASWSPRMEKAGRARPPAGVSTLRLDSPSKHRLGSVFYPRPDPDERPEEPPEIPTERTKYDPPHDMSYPPKWGFRLRRPPFQESLSQYGPAACRKFEANSALQAFGVAPEIDSNLRRGAGSLSPHSSPRATNVEAYGSFAGFHSDKIARVRAEIAGQKHIDNLARRKGEAYPPTQPGYSHPTDQVQYRLQCMASKVSDIAAVPRLATGSQSPRLKESPRAASIGSIASPRGLEDGPRGAHNLLLTESVIRASPERHRPGKESRAAALQDRSKLHVSWSTSLAKDNAKHRMEAYESPVHQGRFDIDYAARFDNTFYVNLDESPDEQLHTEPARRHVAQQHSSASSTTASSSVAGRKRPAGRKMAGDVLSEIVQQVHRQRSACARPLSFVPLQEPSPEPMLITPPHSPPPAARAPVDPLPIKAAVAHEKAMSLRDRMKLTEMKMTELRDRMRMTEPFAEPTPPAGTPSRLTEPEPSEEPSPGRGAIETDESFDFDDNDEPRQVSARLKSPGRMPLEGKDVQT